MCYLLDALLKSVRYIKELFLTHQQAASYLGLLCMYVSDLWDTLLKLGRWNGYVVSAKSADPDQTPHYVASHRGSHCLYYVPFMGQSALTGLVSLGSSLIIFSSFLFFRFLVKCSVDPDKDQHFIIADLGPIVLKTLSPEMILEIQKAWNGYLQ